MPLKGWSDPFLPGDPAPYTDVLRKHRQSMADAYLPPGWIWKNDWHVAPEQVRATGVGGEAALFFFCVALLTTLRYMFPPSLRPPATLFPRSRSTPKPMSMR